MAYEKVVTIYDTEEHAKAAVSALESAGFSSNDIILLNKHAFGTEASDVTPTREPGFWRKLFGGDVREHEAEVYGRAVEEGGYVVRLRVPDTEVDRAMRMLDTLAYRVVRLPEEIITTCQAESALLSDQSALLSDQSALLSDQEERSRTTP